MEKSIAIDTHFHSSDSDGIHSQEQIEENIRLITSGFRGDIVTVMTNHNEATQKISGDSYRGMGTRWKGSGTEASTILNQENGTEFMAHLLLFARHFSHSVDEVFKSVRHNQMYNITKNIETLQENGFEVDNQSFLNFFRLKGYNTENINRFQLARYVISNERNRVHANGALKDYNINNDIDGYVLFLRHFLYEKGDCGEYGYCNERKVNGIHPSVLADLAIKENGIISFAHPQVTCKEGGIKEFRRIFKIYYELYNVRAIEVPAVASIEWIEEIIRLAKEYGCLLTFGTDSHGYDADSTHGNLLHINPYIPKSLIKTNAYLFIDNYCEKSQI